jgi:alkylhydroperoxidase family enzyme
MGAVDIDALRAAGLNDRAIHDATQVIAYFNYINRIADALGVELETFVKPWGEE